MAGCRGRHASELPVPPPPSTSPIWAYRTFGVLYSGCLRGPQRAAVPVNIVAPGVIDTDMHQGRLVGEALAWLSSQTPLGRLGTPQDVADTVAFLASDDSRYITGRRLDVSGGTTV
ncbi:SDR family NAD(P)-dependent oxidoreductase [Microbispora catharanthi]|uniref:SDR family NAD(P)-dependent oxidoreductase n=1 Tax=Microbispora catharanthi TaxID=1712871 RepID=UPI0023EF5636|nr:SDR family oxidoreductase [Microbispora catharanthi]